MTDSGSRQPGTEPVAADDPALSGPSRPARSAGPCRTQLRAFGRTGRFRPGGGVADLTAALAGVGAVDDRRVRRTSQHGGVTAVPRLMEAIDPDVEAIRRAPGASAGLL